MVKPNESESERPAAVPFASEVISPSVEMDRGGSQSVSPYERVD